ncbi:MAG TPA: chemotaxis protein CheW [Burkholderiales bacterium]|nr:chemotaxis protein CheW [Burkholderiales bacterium]
MAEEGKPPATVDWGALARRLAAGRAALQGSAEREPQDRVRILKERAQALGRSARGMAVEIARLEIVEFQLSGERYAFESRYVREVHPLENLTPLPCTPAFVLGIVNLRGEILSVIDLRKFFELPEKGLTDLNRVIVLEAQGMVFGVLADAIAGTRRIAPAELQPSLPTLSGVREAYLKGVTADRMVLLDAARLLADERIVVKEDVAG